MSKEIKNIKPAPISLNDVKNDIGKVVSKYLLEVYEVASKKNPNNKTLIKSPWDLLF